MGHTLSSSSKPLKKKKKKKKKKTWHAAAEVRLAIATILAATACQQALLQYGSRSSSSSSFSAQIFDNCPAATVSKLQKLTVFMKELTKNRLFFSPFFDFLNVFKNYDYIRKPLI
jgi:hypothetical protein